MAKYLSSLAIMMLLTVLPSCGSAHGGSGDHAEVIASPDGSTCYGIYDNDHNLKGGNCK